MRATGAVIASLLMLAAAGCDWREFDKLKEKTPVAAIAAPSGYSASDDFGPVLLALAPPTDGSSAGRFIATATLKTSLAVVSYDPSGRPTGFSPSNDGLDGLQGGPITAIGAIPGGRQVLLGAPTAFLGDVLVMSLDPPYNAAPFIGTSSDPRYGTGVAAGNLSGGADPEVVVASGNKLHVYVDSLPTMDKPYLSTGPSDPCPIDIPNNLPEDDLLNRAVIVAPLLGSGTQIAVGAPVTSGNGHVSIFNFDAAATAPTCAATLTGSEAHFGRSMTLVDVDGDGTSDHLLVGAPQTHAYLYKLPLATGAAPVAMVTDTATDGNFGFSVAALDIDGKPGDEMFVGAPDGTVGGANAGRVSVYTGATMTLLPSTPTFPNPLAQHDPGAGDGYGMAIAGVTFCPGNVDGGVAPCTKLLHVGSRSKVYVYYTLRTPDPRVK
jgi:FG-GAP repeat